MSSEEAAVDNRGTFAAGATSQSKPRGFVLPEAPWLWLLIVFVLDMALPFVPVPNRSSAMVGTVVLTVVYVILVVQFVAQVTRLQLALGKQVPLFVVSLALWALLEWYVHPAVARPLFAAFRHSGGRPSGGQLLPLVLVDTCTALALLCASVFGGSLVSRIITTPNMLGPVCAIIAMIDVWGVLFGGIVSQLMSKAPKVASHGMVHGPAAGVATVSHFHIAVPDIGVGDYLFLGLLFAVLHAHEMNWQAAIRWTIPLMAVALLAVTWGIEALPGLLFIGLGVAIPNLKYFQYTREEKFALLYASIFVVVLTGFLYAGFTRMLPEQKHIATKLQS